jgi:hypothetical protein
MDGISLIVGGALGILAGWAFSSASFKQRDAYRKRRKATQAQEEMSKKKGEAKDNREGGLVDTLQGLALNTLGFGFVILLGIILFYSLF